MTTQRLPVPGQDDGTWGDILNGFLEVSLNADGTLNPSAISNAGAELTSHKGAASGYAPLNSSSLVPTTNLGTGTASSTNYLRGDGTWVTPNSGSSTLSSDSDVTITSPATNQALIYNGSKWTNQAISESDVTSLASDLAARVQVGGDLGGTTTAPTVAKLQGTTLSIPAGGATSYLNATGGWTTPSGNGATSLTGDVTGTVSGGAIATTLTGSSNVESIIAANATVNSKLSSSTAASTYAPLASPTFTGKVTTSALQVTTGAGTANQVLTSDSSGNATWVTPGSTSTYVARAGGTSGTAAVTPWLNVKDYGATGNGSTDDTTALTSAFAAGNTLQLPVYMPAGVYVISSMIDLSSQSVTVIIGASYAGNLFGNGDIASNDYGQDGATTIRQVTAATSALRVGNSTSLSGIAIIAQTATSGNSACLELMNVSPGSTFKNLHLHGGAWNIYTPVPGSGANWGAFSTSFEDLQLNAPGQGYINWSAYNTVTTGCVWKNIYCNADGTTSPTSGIQFSNCNEMEFIQINIEGTSFKTYNGLFTFTSCGTVTVDGLHFERIAGGGGSTSYAWQAFIYNYGGTTLQMRNVSIIDSTMNTATCTYYLVRGENAPYMIDISGIHTGGNTISSGSTYVVGYGAAAASDCEITVHYLSDDASIEFATNLNDTNATWLNTRQQLRRVGSHIMSELQPGGTYRGFTTGIAPTTGTWIVGDEVRVEAPVIAGVTGYRYMITGYRCTTAGTPGTWTSIKALVDGPVAILPLAGFEPYPRLLATGTNATVPRGTASLVIGTAYEAATVTGIFGLCSTAPASATLVRVGIYSISGTTATLVARSNNDTTSFGSYYTGSPLALYTNGSDGYPTSYTFVPGQQYALAVITVGGSTDPIFYGLNGTQITGLAPYISLQYTSQTDLATSYTLTSGAGSTGGSIPWLGAQ